MSSKSDKLKKLEAILDAAYTPGIRLSDFMERPEFIEHFLGVSVPLLSNSVDVRPGSHYGSVRLLRSSTEYTSDLFEIRLKASLDIFPDDRFITEQNRNVTLYKAFLIHEAAHILEGSFEPIKLSLIFQGFSNVSFAKRLFNIIEDFRIEYNICEKMPHRPDYRVSLDFMNTVLIGISGQYRKGSFIGIDSISVSGEHAGDDSIFKGASESKKIPEGFADLNNLVNAYLRKIKIGMSLAECITVNPEPRLKINGHYSSLEDLLNEEALFFSKPVVPELQERGIYNYGGLIDELVRLTHNLKLRPVTDAVRLLPRIYELLELQFKKELDAFSFPKDKRGAKDSKDSGTDRTETSGSSDAQSSSDHNKDNSKDYRWDDPAGQGWDDNFEQASAYEPKDLDELDDIEDAVLARIKANAKRLSGEYSQDDKPDPSRTKRSRRIIYEFNENNQRVKATEIRYDKIKKSDHSLLSRIRNAYPGLIESITQQFLAIKPNKVQLEIMQQVPQMLNPLGLAYALVDDRFASTQRFYDADFMNKLDLAVYFLMDGSGSTSNEIVPEQRSIIAPDRNMNVFDLEKIGVACTYTALTDLEMIDAVKQRMFVFQSYGDTIIYEVPSVAHLHGIKARHGNRDGAAIRGVHSLLKEEDVSDKVLFLIADAMPADIDYEAGPFDTGMAIREVVESGIKVFYLLTKANEELHETEIDAFRIITQYATDKKILTDPRQLPYTIGRFIQNYLL